MESLKSPTQPSIHSYSSCSTLRYHLPEIVQGAAALSQGNYKTGNATCLWFTIHNSSCRSRIFNKLFRNVQPSSSSSTIPDLQPDQVVARLEPVKCLLDLSSQDKLSNPLLAGCDCRGPDSHNHGCSFCDMCHCDMGIWRSYF